MSDRYNPAYIDDEEREFMNRASANMNIRVSEEELRLIKERADREGLKYQTLVKSVLHKYVTGQLVESKRGSA